MTRIVIPAIESAMSIAIADFTSLLSSKLLLGKFKPHKCLSFIQRQDIKWNFSKNGLLSTKEENADEKSWIYGSQVYEDSGSGHRKPAIKKIKFNYDKMSKSKIGMIHEKQCSQELRHLAKKMFGAVWGPDSTRKYSHPLLGKRWIYPTSSDTF